MAWRNLRIGCPGRPSAFAGKADGVARENGLTAFPWDDAIASGMGVLRLSSRDFWSMTPRELGLALRGAAGLPAAGAKFSRSDLAALMQRFPDNQRAT
ncbi:MAG: rcc01693 family protein [Rhodomicrobiaceae bacterium]